MFLFLFVSFVEKIYSRYKKLVPNLEAKINWNKEIYLNCCDIIQDINPELAQYGRDYINKGQI